MNIKHFAGALALTLCAAFGSGAFAQSTATGKARVVFQVSDNDPAKWNLALNNARNVQQEYGAEKVEIEIVAYGPGIGIFKAESTTSNRVSDIAKTGVKMAACENTMAAQKLTKADMNADISYVPAGVVELMKRQSEGWAYIRP